MSIQLQAMQISNHPIRWLLLIGARHEVNIFFLILKSNPKLDFPTQSCLKLHKSTKEKEKKKKENGTNSNTKCRSPMKMKPINLRVPKPKAANLRSHFT